MPEYSVTITGVTRPQVEVTVEADRASEVTVDKISDALDTLAEDLTLEGYLAEHLVNNGWTWAVQTDNPIVDDLRADLHEVEMQVLAIIASEDTPENRSENRRKSVVLNGKLNRIAKDAKVATAEAEVARAQELTNMLLQAVYGIPK